MVTESTNESSSASSSSSSSSSSSASAAARVARKSVKAVSRGGGPAWVVSPQSIIENAARNETLVVSTSIIYNHRCLALHAHQRYLLTVFPDCLPASRTSPHHKLIGLANDSRRSALIRRSLPNDRSIIIDPKLVIIAASHSTRPPNCADVL